MILPLKNMSLKRLILISTVAMVLFMATLLALYFYVFSSELEGQVQIKFEALADNMETRLMECIESIDQSAKKYAYSNDIQSITFFNDPEDYFRAAGPAEDVIDLILGSNPNISAIFINNKDGRVISSDSSKRWIFNEAVEKFGSKLPNEEPFFSTFFYNNGVQSIPYVIYFYPFYNVREGELERNDSAVCAVLCDLDHLINWLSIDNSTRSAMAVLYEGSIVSSNRPLNEDEEMVLSNIEDQRGKVSIRKEQYLSNSVSLPQLGWQLVYVIPENDLLDGIIHIRNLSYGLLLIVAILSSVVMMNILKMITRPVQQIVNDVRLVRRGECSRIKPTKVLELQELSNGINRTLKSIELAHNKEREAQKKLYQAVIDQNLALIYAYRSQINPHFLFNTLECMRSMARHYNAKPLENVITSLSTMFRYSLRSNTVVKLCEEIEHLKSYMSVMKLKTNGSCELRIFVPTETLNRDVLAMCLQPIVENSITHAFVKKEVDQPRIIQVKCWVDNLPNDSVLNIRIADNGCGICEEKLSQIIANLKSGQNIRRETSIGLYNIAKRLKLVFGDESDLVIKSRYGHYTVVEVKVPSKPRDVLMHAN